MARSTSLPLILMIAIAFTSCDRNKPKATSNDINKTTITVNGKKDSVINNPAENYGNTTIAEPCVRCMVKMVQADSHFKQGVIGVPANNIIYTVNWVRADGLPDSVDNKKATNGLRLDITDKGHDNKKVLSYIYDNSIAGLFLVTDFANNSKIEVKADSILLKRIRNACYWGVASSK